MWMNTVSRSLYVILKRIPRRTRIQLLLQDRFSITHGTTWMKRSQVCVVSRLRLSRSAARHISSPSSPTTAMLKRNTITSWITSDFLRESKLETWMSRSRHSVHWCLFCPVFGKILTPVIKTVSWIIFCQGISHFLTLRRVRCYSTPCPTWFKLNGMRTILADNPNCRDLLALELQQLLNDFNAERKTKVQQSVRVIKVARMGEGKVLPPAMGVGNLRNHQRIFSLSL